MGNPLACSASSYPSVKWDFKVNLSRRPETTDPSCKASDTCFGFPVTYGFASGVSGKRKPALLGIQSREVSTRRSLRTVASFVSQPKCPQLPKGRGRPRASGEASKSSGRVSQPGRGATDSTPLLVQHEYIVGDVHTRHRDD